VFTQWLLEHHAKGQAKLNSQVRMDSPVAMRRSGCRRPQSEGLFANPNRQITAPPQAFIVLGTVGHPTLLLRDLVATISVGFVRHIQHPQEDRPQPVSVEWGGMHRRLPKGKDIDDLSDEEVAKSIEKINNRPRKCLGFKTPNQLFLDVTSLLHWRVESALCVVSILGMFMYGFV
jgi:hypothetical protein